MENPAAPFHLHAISPCDGRYADKTAPLREYFSEWALIRYRLRVEIEYFIALCDFDIPALAARAGFAPNAFIRRFREVTGRTPHQYLLNLRYIQAARLLESTDLGIDEIIAEIGVRDRFHFSRTFKRFYGTPPAAFRASRRYFAPEAETGSGSAPDFKSVQSVPGPA